ncbi:MAG TPA: pilus assembly protein PilB, partial [Solibacterales bacterium]|nr:pilus assembly protein PilB [Bryobacterales bacterium]
MATETSRLQQLDQEATQAKMLASRYRCEFVDLKEARIDHELFRSIPVDLMFRYN